jgi:hypothetical protein
MHCCDWWQFSNWRSSANLLVFSLSSLLFHTMFWWFTIPSCCVLPVVVGFCLRDSVSSLFSFSATTLYLFSFHRLSQKSIEVIISFSPFSSPTCLKVNDTTKNEFIRGATSHAELHSACAS